MSPLFFADQLFADGFTDLVSVIPPGAQLSPNSTVAPEALGKIPGMKRPNGTWSGYNWRAHATTAADVHQWCLDVANVGLRADRFPGVDIDCRDESIVRTVEEVARAVLGPAPRRVGSAPKRLLAYRTDAPFGRMRLWIDDKKHLVEVLGQGQQYLIDGIHPKTLQPYVWLEPLGTASELTLITHEQAQEFMRQLEAALGTLCYSTTREGDGRPINRSANVDQDALRAPRLELVRKVVALIPNDNDLFPGRDDYLRMGYAIKAAVGDENEAEGLQIFLQWCEKWEGNERFHGNDLEVCAADWARMTGVRVVGWPWLAETARAYGFNDAQSDFDPSRLSPEDVPVQAPQYSDHWLQEEVVKLVLPVLRYVPQTGKFLVWDGARWLPDAELQAEALVVHALRAIASKLMVQGATEAEKAVNRRRAMDFCSAGKASAIVNLVRLHRSVAVSVGALDHDEWLLNTPNGIVNLKKGELEESRRDALCTKSTSVPPDFTKPCPIWLQYLDETTKGDKELQGYLQRLCGYCLTGSTREQHLTFIYGSGGNGKGVFLQALYGILGDYAYQANMDAFTASANDRHSTEIAAFHGARLVAASETDAGRRWDEQRVKSLTGGDPITARFMRADFFTFLPQFKLVFTGNHQPEIRNVDKAMKRRIQMVHFRHEPPVVDKELGAKLRGEWPAILAWMVRGCQDWQRDGLTPPSDVVATTDEYFDDQDTFGEWVTQELAVGPMEAEHTELTNDLFGSWEQYCHRNGMPRAIGTQKALSQRLVKLKGVEKWQETATRRRGWSGLRLKNRHGGIL